MQEAVIIDCLRTAGRKSSARHAYGIPAPTIWPPPLFALLEKHPQVIKPKSTT